MLTKAGVVKVGIKSFKLRVDSTLLDEAVNPREWLRLNSFIVIPLSSN